MRIAALCFVAVLGAYDSQYDSGAYQRNAIGDARHQSNGVHYRHADNNLEEAERPVTDYFTSATRYPTKQPTMGFDHDINSAADQGLTTAPPTFQLTSAPTTQPTRFPTKVGDYSSTTVGCEYKKRNVAGGAVIVSIKPVGWRGPGELGNYCNLWACKPGNVWDKEITNHVCALRANKIGWAENAQNNGNGESECVHVSCTHTKAINCPPGSSCEHETDLVAKLAAASDATRDQSTVFSDFSTQDANSLGDPGVTNVHHHHKESTKNYRCRHHLDSGDCKCFCHGATRRQDEPNFRRTIHDINRDYAGLSGYEDHRITMSAGRNEHINGGSKHSYYDADTPTTDYNHDAGIGAFDQHQAYLAHPHYTGGNHYAGVDHSGIN